MSSLRAHFERNEDNGQVYIYIAIVGSKDVAVRKPTPEDLQQWSAEYAAFESGKGEEIRPGTPLTDVPGINSAAAKQYRAKNIHNAEELADLTDGACTALGMGVLTARNAAKNLLASHELAALKALTKRADKHEAAKAAQNKASAP